MILQARDGWGALDDWRARYQLRWNKTSDDVNVRDILAFILARAGLKLEVVSQSAAVTAFYPDITISAGTDGKSVVSKLLTFVPDALFIEGNQAFLVNPQTLDDSVYGYGGAHVLYQGRYRRSALAINRVQVEGCDDAGEPVLADSYSWGELDKICDRLKQVEDRNIATVCRGPAEGRSGFKTVRDRGSGRQHSGAGQLRPATA